MVELGSFKPKVPGSNPGTVIYALSLVSDEVRVRVLPGS
jgi:hypothetical protein